jgi:hypothetical protein
MGHSRRCPRLIPRHCEHRGVAGELRLGALLDRLESLGEPEALQIHFRVERWALDEFPLPARLFEDVVEWLYREDRFIRGNLTIAGRIAAPEALAMPLLSVVNPRSVIVPAESILALHHAAPSAEKRLTLSSCVEAIIAAQIGDTEKAIQYGIAAMLMDLADVGGNVKHGCHIASMGGTWMMLAYALGGMRAR